MSRKNNFWSWLLILIGCVSLVLPASAQHFEQVKGTLVSVSAGRNEVFGIDSKGEPWRYVAASKLFAKIRGLTGLVQIAVGGGTLSQLDEVWALAAGGEVYRFDYSTRAFNQVPGWGVTFAQIAVGEGVEDNCHPYEVWAVEGSAQVIWRYNYCTNQFDPFGGPAVQGATGGGDVWGVGGGEASQFLLTLDGSGSFEVGISLAQIAVGVNDVWAINSAGQIFRYVPSALAFVQMGGSLAQIAAGGDGVWGINSEDEIYRYDSNVGNWVQVGGALKSIAVGTGAGVWGVNASNQVFTFVRP